MTKKALIIDNCTDCPFSKIEFDKENIMWIIACQFQLPNIKQYNKTIDEFKLMRVEIPNWCPLSNIEDAYEEYKKEGDE